MRVELDKNPKQLSGRTAEIWNQILEFDSQIDREVSGLDEKLGTVLKKHEYEYMTAYNIYVKRKEKELKETVTKLKKNNIAEIKDQKIQKLE